MLRHLLSAATLLAAAAAPAAVAAALPATLEAALGGAESEDQAGLAYERTVKVWKDQKLLSTVQMRYAPDDKGVIRCTVVAATAAEGETPDAKPGDRCNKDGDDDLPSYAELARMLRGARVTAGPETAGEARYTVEPAPGGKLALGGARIQYDGDGEELVGAVRVARPAGAAPYVASLTLSLKKPAGNLIARVRKVDITYQWGPRDAALGLHPPRAFDVYVDVLIGVFYGLETRVEQRYGGISRPAPR